MRAYENDLFKIEQVQPGLWLLSEKMVKFTIRANAWIVEGLDADLVIDAGWGVVDWPLELLFPQRDKPLWMAVTHAHCDHMSQLHQFQSRRFGHADALPIVQAPTGLNTNAQPWTPRLGIIDAGFEYLNFDAKNYGDNFTPGDLTDLVGEGDRIDLGGTVLDVIETPGHSRDSLTFVDHQRRWIFPGDILINGYIVDVLPDSDKTQALRSHQRLLGLNFEHCFGGHQIPLDRQGAEKVVARYIEHKAKEGLTLTADEMAQ